jgi:hypothetical protein
MPYLIVEYRFDPPLTDEKLRDAVGALTPCLEIRNIRRLRSWLAEDRRRMICEYHAADLQSLRDAYHMAKVPYVSIWPGQLFEYAPPEPAYSVSAHT